MSVYIAVHLDDRGSLANFPEYGFWNNYFVYKFSDDLVPRLNLVSTRLIKLDESIANGWKFISTKDGFIKFPKDNWSLFKDQLDPAKVLPNSYKKDKYPVSPEELASAVEFMKTIIYAQAVRDFEQLWNVNKSAQYSSLTPKLKQDEELLKFYSDRLLYFKARLDGCSTVPDCEKVLVELVLEVNPTNYPNLIDGDSDVQRTPESQT